MNAQDASKVKAFLLTAPWQQTERGVMATVWMEKEAIHPDCIPDGVKVDEILWGHRDGAGCVPVRLVKK